MIIRRWILLDVIKEHIFSNIRFGTVNVYAKFLCKQMMILVDKCFQNCYEEEA